MATVKDILRFVLKSLCFVIIFWTMWLWVFKPLSSPARSEQAAQDAQSNAQFDAYDKQVARVNQQLDFAEAQQLRREKNLAAEEENARRFDAVLKVWEKQTGSRK